MNFAVGFDVARDDGLAVDDDLDEPLAATDRLFVAGAMQIDGVANDLTAGGRCDAAVGDGERRFDGESYASHDADATGVAQFDVIFTRPDAVDLKLDGVGIAIGDVGAAGANSLTPGGVVELVG